jgi:hypothetical protein
MVLQNKYKARASKRYNAARGGGAAGEGESSRAGARGRGRVRGRGRGGAHSDPFRAAVEGGGEASGSGEEEDEEEEEGEAEAQDAFPALQASTAGAASSQARQSRGEAAKYARRPMESNAWRYAEPEAEVDPHAGECMLSRAVLLPVAQRAERQSADVAYAARAEPQEPEPEVDLSNLFAKVAQLDSSRSAIPGLPSEEQRRELEEDVDRSLAYLHARQRERERGKGAAAREEEKGGVERREITEEERREEEEERREMGKERERAEALRGEWSPPVLLPATTHVSCLRPAGADPA